MYSLFKQQLLTFGWATVSDFWHIYSYPNPGNYTYMVLLSSLFTVTSNNLHMLDLGKKTPPYTFQSEKDFFFEYLISIATDVITYLQLAAVYLVCV